MQINRVSENSKEKLIEKIREKNFSFAPEHKLKLAFPIDQNINQLIENIIYTIKKNQDNDFISDGNFFFYQGKTPLKIAFLFPGQGSQYVNMGKEILNLCKKSMFDEADKIFSQISSKNSLMELIYPEKTDDCSGKMLQQTDIAQPAIGFISSLYLNLLNELNIYPDAVSGHSFGEISALFASDSIDFKTFMKIASMRGKFMNQCGENGDAGSMMAVIGPLAKIEEVIKEENLNIVIANKNSPMQNVVSGHKDEIEKAGKIFRKYRLKGIKLPVAAAFHSLIVQDAVKPFSLFLETEKINSPKIPLTSNTSGNFHSRNPSEIKKLLTKQLINPVLFTDNLKCLEKSGINVFIEVGPKKVLKDISKQNFKESENLFFASVDESCGNNSLKDFSSLLSLLYSLDFKVDIDKWNSFFN